MLNDKRRALGQRLNTIPAKFLAKTRISPNTITTVGLLASFVVAWVLATGHLFLGGFLVILSGAFDLLDGALARLTGRVSKFGGILDSTFDRLSEAAILIGLMAFYLREYDSQGHPFQAVLLIGAILVGSMLTSYVRARAEAMGLQCHVGIFTRPERVVLLAIGLIFSSVYSNMLLIVLWIMAILTNFIALQRLFHVRQQCDNDDVCKS